MGQSISRAEFAAWNEEMVRQFDPDAYHNHPSLVVRTVERMRVRTLLRLLDVKPGNRVLEVGCGAGNILAQISAAELCGVDISESMVAKAKARLGPAANIQLADAENLPFENQRFDRVYCSEVLEHVIDPGVVLREMRRVVTHNGVVAVSVPNETFINGVKRIVFKAGPLGRRLLGMGEGGYESVERMDDAWHLHAFDRRLLEEAARPWFHIEQVVAIPSPLSPIRFAARLLPR
jgi:ubiquinone/menaquinone biosynthesis C-methylase UbiE